MCSSRTTLCRPLYIVTLKYYSVIAETSGFLEGNRWHLYVYGSELRRLSFLKKKGGKLTFII